MKRLSKNGRLVSFIHCDKSGCRLREPCGEKDTGYRDYADNNAQVSVVLGISQEICHGDMNQVTAEQKPETSYDLI